MEECDEVLCGAAFGVCSCSVFGVAADVRETLELCCGCGGGASACVSDRSSSTSRQATVMEGTPNA